MRVVLDCNVIVSAARIDGTCRTVVDRVRTFAHPRIRHRQRRRVGIGRYGGNGEVVRCRVKP